MWATNDTALIWLKDAGQLGRPADHEAIQRAARREQAAAFARVLKGIGRAIRRLAATLGAPYRVWHDYQETCRELSALDDRALADLGIARADIPRLAAGIYPAAGNGIDRFIRPARDVAAGANVNRPQVAA